MSQFNQDLFNRFVIENNVVGFFKEPITLKSGRTSHFYVNWRTVVEDVYLTDYLTNFILDFTKSRNIEAETFYGVPEGATKVGLIAQYKNAHRTELNVERRYSKGSHVLSMGRAFPKEHGASNDNYFLGIPKGKTVIIEDVTTTGGSLIQTIDSLMHADVSICAALSLTNRMEKNNEGKSVEQLLQSLDIPFYSMSKATTLLPSMYKLQNPGKVVGYALEKEFQEYGIEPLKLE